MSAASDPFVLVRTCEDDGGSPSMLTDDMSASWVEDLLPWFRDRGETQIVWSDAAIQRIQSRRVQLPNSKLFIDEILSLAEVDPALYPPTSEQGLSALLTAISNSPFDTLKRTSLIYYLMLDLDAKDSLDDMQDDQSVPEPNAGVFADRFFVLPHFRNLMHGYWLLDKGDYEEAIPYLTSPDFISKIYRTLFLASDRSPLDRSRLLLRFLRASTRPSSSPKDSQEQLEELQMQVEATCWVKGPSKAFFLVRKMAWSVEDEDAQQETRYRLMNKIFEHCFSPPNGVAIKNLLGCYLDTEEQIALETFVLSPPASMSSSSSCIAADVLIVRYINQGRYMDAVRFDRRLGPDVHQGHSSTSDPAIRAKLMEKRKRMVAGAREILPEVQKELLRIEESMEISADKAKDSVESSEVGELKMSWEQVPRPGEAPISTASKLTPLSASVALRSSENRKPTTQAALLSAVVRASASPRGASASPARAKDMEVASPPSFSPSSAAPAERSVNGMVGFLARNSLTFGQSPSKGAPALENDDVEVEDTSASPAVQPEFSSKPGYRLTDSKVPSSPASPWRNTQPLTSTSPFSGQPKIPTNTFVTRFDNVHSTPTSVSASPFRPANTSPFITASGSSRQSPFASPITQKLPGALGLVSKQGRKRYSAEHDIEMESEEEVQDADDTFVGIPTRSQVKVGRYVQGRHAQEEDEVMPELKHTRSQSGVVKKGKEKAEMSKSRSEVSIKRATRSSSAANRHPLTLSNLAARDKEDVLEAGPIARRTRAATASIQGESLDGIESIEDASTAYSISEMGEVQDGVPELPKKKATNPTTRVRRSSRLSSTEPEEAKENDAPKRRTKRASKTASETEAGVRTRSGKRTMPGALED